MSLTNLSILTFWPAMTPTADARTRHRPALSAGVLVAAVGALAVVAVAAICAGSTAIPVRVVLDSFVAFDPAVHEHVVVRGSRVPRTVAALVAGAALGACGSLMQGVTRNPLADPGLLGVGAGSALLIAIGIHWFGVGSVSGYIWFALAGAALASVAVYAVASRGRGGPTPVKLTLSGAAFGLFLGAITSAVTLLDRETRYGFGFWSLGNVAIPSLDPVGALAPFFLAGGLVALLSGRALNALSLGDEVASGIGMRTGRVRVVLAGGIVLLCGASTALVGPLTFVGLLVPFAARAVTGPDYRWLTPLAAVFGAVLVVAADIVGRLVVAPAELNAGIVVAVVGAPAFIVLARRSRMSL